MDRLNENQRQAVEAVNGPLLIVAGPGTGKTKTLVARIVHIIESGAAKPSEVLALTFTNKAAAEMRERVATAIAGDAPNVTTFHALCYQLLMDENRQELKFVSEPERAMIIKQLRKSAELKTLSAQELGLEISRLKNGASGDESAAKLLAGYNQALQAQGLCDFDDLLLKTRELLTTKKPKLPYKYILVDEFQDTNALQYELLQLLRINDNICVIGDPLQSIYGFRGADSTMFDRFCADFPSAQTVHLSINYRSVPEVVQLTNTIFPDSPKLEAHTKVAGEVKVVEVLNEYSEAAWIIGAIEQSIGGSTFLKSHDMDYAHHDAGHTFRDFAIIYRTHRVGRTAQKLLAESGIPYQVVGEGSFYERPAIWAVIHVMRYLAESSAENRAMLGSLAALKKLSPGQIDALLEKLDSEQKVSELASATMDTFALDTTDRAQFISSLVRFDDAGLTAYITHVDELLSTNFYDPAADAMTLTTIHAAKGLEFTHVFLVGAEEGILPHERSDIDEERRLFYVAVSRAEAKLHILYARTRSGAPAKLSRFARDIDTSILPQTQDENMSAQQRRLTKRTVKRSQGTLFDI